MIPVAAKVDPFKTIVMKDRFSAHSDQYAKYRPAYPSDLFDYLNALVPHKQAAWDCGTGNGQVAYTLAKTFDKVFATDISSAQIGNALRADNIQYSVQPAEKTDFGDGLFDLIVVAQAIHWFDFERFYSEVRRTSREGAWICVTGYSRIEISGQIDAIITDFYQHVIGAYWDEARKHVDARYASIPFPFREIQAPEYTHRLSWTFEHLIGYLNTWSAVKQFIQHRGYNPVEALRREIEPHWGGESARDVQFPLLLRMGQVT